MNLFERWGWEDNWALLLYLGVIVGAVIGVVALCADHRVLYYEISRPDDAMVPTFCVYADRNWEASTRVGCFSDSQKALDLLVALNDQLRKGYGK